MAGDFATNVMNIAVGIVIAFIFILLMLNVFSDMIFGFLADIRDSWNRHMRR